MSSQPLIPPLRDLPAGRLAERSQHLRAEIAGGRNRVRSRRLVVAVALAIVLGILLSTPAFGLRDQVFHFFTGKRHPPALIVKRFENMAVAPRGEEITRVQAGKARNVMSVPISGWGKWSVWVAPTTDGGFCSTHLPCDAHHTVPLSATLSIGGPSRKASQPFPWSPSFTVVFEGFTDVKGAYVAMRFEDGGSERLPLVWVTPPIRAGFFVYQLPKAHWKIGARPVEIVVQDSSGKVLAKNRKVAAFFRKAQGTGLATPAAAESHSIRIWLFLAVAAAVLAGAALLVWRWRGLAVSAPLLVAAIVTAAFAGTGVARSGYHPPPRPKPAPYHPPPTYHSYASGYVREGFLGSRQARDRFLIARTPAEGLRWDRWITHHRVSPPQAADFTRQALVGVFLLGEPSARVQGVAVTKLDSSGATLGLTLVVSPDPILPCGPGPDAPVECEAFYKPPDSSYHAFTIIAIPKARAARVRRIVVVDEHRQSGPIQVAVPHID